MPELTGPQVITFEDVIKRTTSVDALTYRKLRQMRKDPVISLVRTMFFAGVYASKWNYTASDDSVHVDKVEFVKATFEPIRRHFVSTAALGCFDFGWQAFEKVYEVDSTDYAYKLKKLKPLLQESCEIQTDKDTGSFIGIKQGNVNLDIDSCLLCNFDVEGTMWEGRSTLANAEEAYDSTKAIFEASRRYDQKIAGAHWIIRYPVGKTPVQASNGDWIDTSNHVIARDILKSLQSSGMVAIPVGASQLQQLPTDAKGGWDIELVTASGQSVDFNARFSYLDTSKCRALGFPERSLMEGHFGTKAEAGAHQDFVITMIEYRHACLLELLNWHAVNQLLVLNYGIEAENTVKIEAAPLNDGQRAMLLDIYSKILATPDGLLQELQALDFEAVADTLGIPRLEIDDDSDELPDSLSKRLDTKATEPRLDEEVDDS